VTITFPDPPRRRRGSPKVFGVVIVTDPAAARERGSSAIRRETHDHRPERDASGPVAEPAVIKATSCMTGLDG
jgi:hypothetical protein